MQMTVLPAAAFDPGWAYLDLKVFVMDLPVSAQVLVLGVLVIVAVGMFSRAMAVFKGEGSVMDVIIVTLGTVAAALAAFIWVRDALRV